jgi:exocyst complex component 2
MFPEATGDISSERFDPAYFLLEHHHNTAFDDLKAGLEHLRQLSPLFYALFLYNGIVNL